MNIFIVTLMYRLRSTCSPNWEPVVNIACYSLFLPCPVNCIYCMWIEPDGLKHCDYCLEKSQLTNLLMYGLFCLCSESRTCMFCNEILINGVWMKCIIENCITKACVSSELEVDKSYTRQSHGVGFSAWTDDSADLSHSLFILRMESNQTV